MARSTALRGNEPWPGYDELTATEGRPCCLHDLRHTAGSLLVRVMDPLSVKDIMGHADLATTERYLHAVRALGRLTKPHGRSR